MENQERVKTLYAEGKKGHEIAELTGINRSYVYRIIKKINKITEKETSLLNGGGVGDVTSPKLLNVHAQQVRFFVSFMSDRYKSHPNRNFKEFIPDVTIQCEGRFIYASCTKKFEGSNELESMRVSLNFWDHVQRRLEDRLGISIGGRGKVAFEFLKQEQETRDSFLGMRDFKNNKRSIVFHNEDGKLRLTTDWSDGEVNHETHHKRDNHTDSITFNDHVNSILNNPMAPTFAENVKLVHLLALSNKDALDGINSLSVMFKSFVEQELKKNTLKNSSEPLCRSNSEELRSFDYIG